MVAEFWDDQWTLTEPRDPVMIVYLLRIHKMFETQQNLKVTQKLHRK